MVFIRSRRLARAVFALTSLMFAICRAARWNDFAHMSAMRKACSTASASCWYGMSHDPGPYWFTLSSIFRRSFHCLYSQDSIRGSPWSRIIAFSVHSNCIT